MIGSSTTIFQRGNNVNEVHTTGSFGGLFAPQDEAEREKLIVQTAEEKQWKPEAIVDDAEVKKIVYATSINPGSEGYHKFAGDGVTVINLSGDPNLYNPAKEKAEAYRIKREKRQAGLVKIKELHLAELVSLRKMVPVGQVDIEVTLTLPVTVEFTIHGPQTPNIIVDGKDGKPRQASYAWEVLNREEIYKRSELQAFMNCPHRKKYHDRCKELDTLYELRDGDSSDAAYWAEKEEN
jgi:hypothetical protein